MLQINIWAQEDYSVCRRGCISPLSTLKVLPLCSSLIIHHGGVFSLHDFLCTSRPLAMSSRNISLRVSDISAKISIYKFRSLVIPTGTLCTRHIALFVTKKRTYHYFRVQTPRVLLWQLSSLLVVMKPPSNSLVLNN